MTQREALWWDVLQNGALAVAAAFVLVETYQSGRPWWLAAAMLAALAVLTNRWPERDAYLSLALEAAIAVGLSMFHPMALILSFILSARAVALLPPRTALAWLGVLTLAYAATRVAADGWLSGLLTTLGLAAGYGSFGFAHYSRRRAEAAGRESQALLAELQEAHRQLQAHAGQVEELAAAQERNRLAREMHDTLGHRLTVAAVQLEGARRLIPTDPERAARMVGAVHDEVREALGELRGTVARLRTPLEADLALPQALSRLATGFAEATHLDVRLTLPEEVTELPPAHRIALYRAAQEALTNVQRHAGASQVWLSLDQQDGGVALVVGDDGVGFPPGAEGSGFGLRGLRERAAQLGGRVSLDARPGGGAQLSFCLPLPGGREEAGIG